MDEIINKLHKYYIFDIIVIATIFLIIGIAIQQPIINDIYSMTPTKLAGFLEKDDVNVTERDKLLKEEVKFESIDLSYKNFSGVDLRSLIALNSKIFNLTLEGSHLENFQFSGNLSNTNMSNLLYFTGADLKKVNLTEANLATANLYDTNLTDADLTSADLTDADLTHADLTNANLTFTDLKEAILIDADLTNATLIGADLTDAILLDTNLTNADVNHANFNGTFFNCASLNTINITEDLTIQNIILLDSNFKKITSC
ncbi:MAG TPA: pentapeptide repeat-containing protein [Nitrososphaeraceae archaeon]|nr:pentapeptide repeat-containing protein [Nitrososphaeraceae archaeon]